MRRVLVLEASDTVRGDLLLGLRAHGIEAEGAPGISQAAVALGGGVIEVVILGLESGLVGDLRARIATSSPRIDIIVLVKGTVADGLAAIRQGATDFVASSAGAGGVAAAVAKIEARRAAASAAPVRGRVATEGVAEPQAPPATPLAAAGVSPSLAFVGASPKVAAVMEMVRRLAGVRAAIVVGGESGTGKELVARALHQQSPWRAGPFVAVNCGAFPAGLIESELFGHVRGSFTDAVKDKRGLFEAAHGGTLFLDEIADLPLLLQSKLLRAVQDGVIRKIGDVEDVRVEVRIVAATARNLAEEVRAGRFREDLYYRLAALSIQIPPLRERPDDILLLAEHFLQRARAKLGRAIEGIDEEASRLLMAHPWPGNVRELENTIERAVVLCSSGRIDVASLPERIVSRTGGIHRNGVTTPASDGQQTPGGALSSNGVDPAVGEAVDLSIKRAARRTEQDLIRRALAKTGGNRTRAAELLEISHRALLYKMKEYEIVVSRTTGGGIDP